MLIEVLSVVTPVFVIASIGYVWVTRKQPFDNHTISSLVIVRISNCITPVLPAQATFAHAAFFSA